MNARKALLHVWTVGLLSLAIYLTIASALGWWLGWVIGTGAVLIVLWAWIEWWGKIKQDMLKGLPETLKFVPAQIEAYPATLDRATLAAMTEALDALGFVHLNDYQIDPAEHEVPLGFARCLGHPQQHCYVEMFQAFPKEGDALPLYCSVMSYLDDNWVLATTTTPFDSIASMWRDRRTVASYHADASPEDLFRIHLERRQQMVEDLGVQPQSEISWPCYEQLQQLEAMKRRRNLQKRNIAIALIQATYAEFNPVTEQWGDYGKQLKIKN